MTLSVAAQLKQALIFAAAGAGLGLLYDLLSPLRWRFGMAWLWDGSFVLLAGLFLFASGLQTEEGALRLYMPLAAAGGAMLWRGTASFAVRRGEQRALAWGTERIARLVRPPVRRAALLTKKLFSSLRIWGTIQKEAYRERRSGRRQTAYEAAQSEHSGAHRHRGAHRLCLRQSCAHEGQARRGRAD